MSNLNIREIDKLINHLQELKKEQRKKEINELKERIKSEIIKEIDNVLMHFESDELVKFINNTEIDVCFDYNYCEIIKLLKEKLSVDAWEVQ